MLLKYPYLLFALVALAIPIIIHFFKLRKFQKTPFSNVFFLKKINIESRKSSQLKKWLVLLSRLGILTALILAFTFPYLPAKSKINKPSHQIIYLDNSFSMQAISDKGQLLAVAKQDLLNSIPSDATFSLFTNTEIYPNISISEYRNEIINIDYSTKQLTQDQILLQFNALKQKGKDNQLFAISDFQSYNNIGFDKILETSKNIIQLSPQSKVNIAIDSLWITSLNQKKTLYVNTSSTTPIQSTLSIKNDSKLIGKASLDFSKQSKITSEFSLPSNTIITGVASLNDANGLTFDNTMFFSVNDNKKPKITIIGDAFTDYLQKIFPKEEFEITTYNSSFKFNNIENADFIILNELEQLEDTAFRQIHAYFNTGGKICIIPSSKKLDFTIEFLKQYFNIEVASISKERKKITQINYQHPIYKGVFTKQITNFQYPSVKESLVINSKNWILNYEDQSPFLVKEKNLYLFTSALNQNNTNFKSSPIIVPTFFNMIQEDSNTSKLAYQIGNNNEIKVAINTSAEEVLTISNQNTSYIPLQQQFKNYVQLITQEEPSKADNYWIKKGDDSIQPLSFNYSRKENKNPIYSFPENSKISTSLKSSIENITQQNRSTDLWKWFLTFAILLVIVEIILLKFLK